MRILVLLCALSAVSARNAHAIRQATQAEIDAIEAQISTAKGMDEKIDLAKTKLEAASSSIEASKANLRALERDVEREEAKQRAARTKAIHMTILAYGLTPDQPSGRSVMRSTKDRTITWLPVAGEGEDRLVQSAKGNLGRRPSKMPAGNIAGVTYPDGVTYIPASTFNRGPGFLASVLLHERIHFEQYTTDGKGNVMSTA